MPSPTPEIVSNSNGENGPGGGPGRVSTNPAHLPTAEKIILVHRRLCATYDCPTAWVPEPDPIDELMGCLLGHRSRNRDAGRAFRQLRARYPTWEAVMEAPVEEIEDAISPVTWPEQKAPRIQAVLGMIKERTGSLNLDLLSTMPIEEARAWLEELPGVGPRTSAAVLNFSRLHRRALPVDSNHLRVAVRLGLVPPAMPVGQAGKLLERLLPEEWDAQDVHDHHEVMVLHGQRCCFYRAPACDHCAVLDLCPAGQAFLED